MKIRPYGGVGRKQLRFGWKTQTKTDPSWIWRYHFVCIYVQR